MAKSHKIEYDVGSNPEGTSSQQVNDVYYDDSGTPVPQIQTTDLGKVLTAGANDPVWAEGAGGGTWGSITGDIEDQEDLNTALTTLGNRATAIENSYVTKNTAQTITAKKSFADSVANPHTSSIDNESVFLKETKTGNTFYESRIQDDSIRCVYDDGSGSPNYGNWSGYRLSAPSAPATDPRSKLYHYVTRNGTQQTYTVQLPEDSGTLALDDNLIHKTGFEAYGNTAMKLFKHTTNTGWLCENYSGIVASTGEEPSNENEMPITRSRFRNRSENDDGTPIAYLNQYNVGTEVEYDDYRTYVVTMSSGIAIMSADSTEEHNTGVYLGSPTDTFGTAEGRAYIEDVFWDGTNDIANRFVFPTNKSAETAETPLTLAVADAKWTLKYNWDLAAIQAGEKDVDFTGYDEIAIIAVCQTASTATNLMCKFERSNEDAALNQTFSTDENVVLSTTFIGNTTSTSGKYRTTYARFIDTGIAVECARVTYREDTEAKAAINSNGTGTTVLGYKIAHLKKLSIDSPETLAAGTIQIYVR